MRAKPPQAHRIDRKAVSGNSQLSYRHSSPFSAPVRASETEKAAPPSGAARLSSGRICKLGYRPAGAFIAASDRLINPMSSESVESSRLVSFEITDL